MHHLTPLLLAQKYLQNTAFKRVVQGFCRLMRLYIVVDKKICTLVHALRLCTGRTAHKGSRGIAVLYMH